VEFLIKVLLHSRNFNISIAVSIYYTLVYRQYTW